MGVLGFEDIENLSKYFPPTTPSGQVCWAVSGGGAVKFLIEANEVVGRKTVGWPNKHSRDHKDLDVAVFFPDHSRLKLERPHEIYRVCFWEKPVRCDYRTEAVQTGFYIELLTDYNFGFPPPTAAEIVLAHGDDGDVYCLSPEYIVASRLFHPRTPRPDIDDQDVANLKARFELDLDLVVAAVARSHYSFLSRDRVNELALGNRYQEITQDIDDELKRRFISLPESCLNGGLPYIRRSLLCFKQGDLNREVMSQGISAGDHLTRPYQKQEGCVHWLWAIAFALYHNGGQYDRKLAKAITHHLKGATEGEPALGMSVEFCLGLHRLKEALAARSMSAEFNRMVYRLTLRFFETHYRNVFLAELNTISSRLADAPNEDAAVLRLRDFLRFAGWRSWTKGV